MSLEKVKEKLDDMAVKLLDDAMKDGTATPIRVDVFKVVQAYYVGAQKATKGSNEPSEPGSTMEGLRNSVQEPTASQGDDDDDET